MKEAQISKDYEVRGFSYKRKLHKYALRSNIEIPVFLTL